MRSALHLAVCCLAAGLVVAAQSTAPGKPQPTPTPTPQPGVVPGIATGGQKPQPTPTPPPRRDPFSPQPYPQKPPPSETPQPAVVNDLDWRFTVKAGQVVSSTIITENACQSRHHYEVVNPPLPAFMRLRGESAADINPLSRHVFPVEFDATVLPAGLYQGTVTVRCLTCRTERGCP